MKNVEFMSVRDERKIDFDEFSEDRQKQNFEKGERRQAQFILWRVQSKVPALS